MSRSRTASSRSAAHRRGAASCRMPRRSGGSRSGRPRRVASARRQDGAKTGRMPPRGLGARRWRTSSIPRKSGTRSKSAADQEAHLVAWLSKRLGTQLKIPQLSGLGFNLVGGRLLPGDQGPVAQFMYQDAQGQRLTLYVRTNRDTSQGNRISFCAGRQRAGRSTGSTAGSAMRCQAKSARRSCCASRLRCISTSTPEVCPASGESLRENWCNASGTTAKAGRLRLADTAAGAGGYPAPALLPTTSSSLLFSSLLFS